MIVPGLAATGLAATAAEIPAVPPGHPRVYVRPSDLPGIRAKLEMPEFARSWQVVQQGAAGGSRKDASPMCSAFLYLVQRDRAQGRRAIDAALTGLAGCTNATHAGRVLDSPFHWAACVYDWCYDLTTAQERQRFVGEFTRLAALHSPWFPATASNCLAVVGHDSEGWLLTGQLPAGVAIHDEDRTMYDAAARLFLDTFVPPRNYHYAGHAHHQGAHYNTRLVYDLAAAWLFRRLGAGDVFSREQQFVPYEILYCLRPDGEQLRRGDATVTGRAGRKRAIMILAGAYYEDPILAGAAQGDLFLAQCAPMEEVFDLLFRPPGLATRPLADLPQAKFFPPPIGELAARTGWTIAPDSPDVLVHMRLGGTFFGNHQKRDMGTFQVFYRAPLAIASGFYGGYGNAHWRYAHETLAGNGLLIHDPRQQPAPKQVDTGGQIVPPGGDHPLDLAMLRSGGYEQGIVTAQAFGPDPRQPEYAFIAGDITRAYAPRAERVTRAMVTLFTGEARSPAVLVVHDRVVVAAADFRKTWLLHTLEKPAVAPDGAAAVCDGPAAASGGPRGGLRVRSFLPADARLRTVGGPGREFWSDVTGTNYPPVPDGRQVEVGAWRLEITPAQARRDDTFLTALVVADAGADGVPEPRLITGDGAVGVAFRDRAVLFADGDAPATRLTFVLDGPAESRILICGLAAGPWRVTRDGREQPPVAAVPATSDSLHLDGGPGRYILERGPAAAAVRLAAGASGRRRRRHREQRLLEEGRREKP
jgi:heparin/heparan-sulfate lyase